jgi:hypothetical protein
MITNTIVFPIREMPLHLAEKVKTAAAPQHPPQVHEKLPHSIV